MIAMLEAVLHRPKTVFVLMLALITAGILAYIGIPKEDAPDIDVPVFVVGVTQQGISPEDAEKLLIRPIESRLRSLDGLKNIWSTATEGHANFILEFDISFDKDQALLDTREKVDEAKSELPEDANEPYIAETNFALIPTILVAVSGNIPERTLYMHARRLQDVIESIDTVRSASLSGHRSEQLEVIIDTMKMESYSITQAELFNSLTLNNKLVPAGYLDAGIGKFNIKVPGLVENVEDTYNLPIKQSGEGVVTLSDVADIKRTFVDQTKYSRVNGRPAISISVTKRIGTNIIENNNAVREVVKKEIESWSDAIKVDILSDMSSNIYGILGSLQSSIMTAIFLVMVLVVAALGVKSALLVGLAIPTSFMMGFLILSFFGMTVNTMVMFSLVLTVGMLVDGAIVIVEYADRKIHEGMEQADAYIRAARLMFWPIVTSTATTLVAFLPLLLWPGVAGEFMSYLPKMVIIVLSGSLVTAMVFLPVTGGIFSNVFMWIGRNAAVIWSLVIGAVASLAVVHPLLAALFGSFLPQSAAELTANLLSVAAFIAISFYSHRFMKPVVKWSQQRAHERMEVTKSQALLLAGETEFDHRKIPGFIGLYIRFLRLLAGNPIGNILTGLVILIVCVTIVSVFAVTNRGVEFFVEEEPDRGFVVVSARGNMSTSEANDLVSDVEKIVLETDGVLNVVTSAYTPGNGGGGEFTGGSLDMPADVIGDMNIELDDFCCRRPSSEIFQEIRDRSSQLPGIKVESLKIEGGPPTGKDIQLEVRSNDYDLMVSYVDKVRQYVDGMDHLLDVEDTRPLPGIEWQLVIDREKAARYQASIVSVGSLVQMVTNGVQIGTYRPTDSDDEVEIRVRLPESDRSLEQFDSLLIQTPLGQVPIANFVEKVPRQQISTISRRNGLYSMTVKATVDKSTGILVDEKVNELKDWLETQTWPSNVYYQFRGADEDQRESGEFLIRAMIASLFLMFIILLTQFNSFYQTFLTLMTVVMSVIGVLLGIIITGQKFSIIMTGTGLVALAGIVVNNAIVLIHTYNRFRDYGVEQLESTLKTAAQRIRPVLLTTVTTIAGLIPMATQTSLDFFNRVIEVGDTSSVIWVQLSTTVIFGLAFSTLLTLVFIPTMLAAPQVWREFFQKISRRFGIFGKEAKLPEEPAELMPEEPAELISEEPAELISEEPADLIPEEPADLIPEEPADLIPEEPNLFNFKKLNAAPGPAE